MRAGSDLNTPLSRVRMQNRRPDYIATFVDKLINWDKVAERYAAAK